MIIPKPLQFSSTRRMEVAAVLFPSGDIKLRFCSLNTHRLAVGQFRIAGGTAIKHHRQFLKDFALG